MLTTVEPALSLSSLEQEPQIKVEHCLFNPPVTIDTELLQLTRPSYLQQLILFW